MEDFEKIWERIWREVQRKCVPVEYWRIITDVVIPFPRNYELIGHHSLMELTATRWDKSNGGWCKPDRIIGDVEIHYLNYRNGKPF